jgi:hypothetical protein
MLSKLITFTLITSLLAAPSPVKDTANTDLEGFDLDLDGLFSLSDLGDIAGGDTEITHEKKEDEEINFALSQIVEEIEQTTDNEEDDIFEERIVNFEEEEEVEEVEKVEETSVKSETEEETEGAEETETITDEGEKEEDGKHKSKGHNYKHKKHEH